MRLLGTVSKEIHARRLSAYLTKLGIQNCYEPEKGSNQFVIWVYEEDLQNSARMELERFLANPDDPIFNVPIDSAPLLCPSSISGSIPARESFKRPLFFVVTRFFIGLCTLFFLMSVFQEFSFYKRGIPYSLMITPLQANCLYDLPPAFESIEKIQERYVEESVDGEQEISDTLSQEIYALQTAPYWRGIYDWLLLKWKGQDPSVAEGVLFFKIRQGEIWRLFSPALLHRDLLHIVFNMIWLWVLGRPIEKRIGAGRMLLFTLFVGVISNTAQYLISGPFFIGYSGVITGLAGFIWTRKRVAPWEGYPLPRSTILFLGFFVLAMLVFQVVSFAVQFFSNTINFLSIANTAHIVGGITGILLGYLPFFQWRDK